MDLTHAAWRKSSYSNTNGAECVEVAAWRKSSHSSTQGDDCVEAGSGPAAGVAVRDSKDLGGPALAFTPAEWRTFTHDIKTA